MDLFFSHPADPASVIEARNTEMTFIRKWLDAAAEHRLRNTAARGTQTQRQRQSGEAVGVA